MPVSLPTNLEGDVERLGGGGGGVQVGVVGGPHLHLHLHPPLGVTALTAEHLITQAWWTRRATVTRVVTFLLCMQSNSK